MGDLVIEIRGTATGGGVTTIGHDNLFMSYTHVAHDCHVGSKCVMANYATLGGHVTVVGRHEPAGEFPEISAG